MPDRRFKGPNALLNLADAFRQAEERLPEAKRIILENCGLAIAHEAEWRIIGRTSGLPAASPFPAWGMAFNPGPSFPWLAGSTIKQKQRKGWGRYGNPKSILYASGQLAESISFYIQGNSVHVGSPFEPLKYLENGTIYMPPRPVFGPALIITMPKMMPRIEGLLTRTIMGERPRW